MKTPDNTTPVANLTLVPVENDNKANATAIPGDANSQDGDEASSETAVDEPPNVLSDTSKSDFVRAIFDPADTTFPRLACPEPDAAAMARYATLLVPSPPPASDPDLIRYFFALDLTQCVDLLPRLLGSIIEAIRFLGPANCALSIVEGNSDDGTPEVLAAVRGEVEAMGTRYFFETSSVNPKAGAEDGGGERIVGLAALRNLALRPLLDDARSGYAAENETTVVFLNDVAACMEDILELAYQRVNLAADMTCAMDWTYVGPNPTFYDVWIARTMSGESFFNIPADGSWDYVSLLFTRYSASPEKRDTVLI